jgi:hypothetical protein
VEQRDPAVNNLPTTLGGKDGMMKTSIGLQDLRRKIYLKAKADKASAGTGGVMPGYMRLWDYLMITESDITGHESAAGLIGPINLWKKLTE